MRPDLPGALRTLADQVEARQCTGVAASWCPVHGACSCATDEHGARLIFDDVADPRCRLHGDATSHAASKTERGLTTVAEVIAGVLAMHAERAEAQHRPGSIPWERQQAEGVALDAVLRLIDTGHWRRPRPDEPSFHARLDALDRDENLPTLSSLFGSMPGLRRQPLLPDDVPPPPPYAGDVECCASGSCEVCQPHQYGRR